MSLGYITVNEFPRCSLVEWGVRKADLLERQLLAHRVDPGIDQEGRYRRVT